MRALITGITGQDGAYLAKFLLNKGYRVAGFAPRRSSDNTWRLQCLNVLSNPNFEIVAGDVTDAGSVDEAVCSFKPSEIYNLAAQSHVGSSFDCPASTFAINAGGTLNFLEAVKKHDKTIRFYQASTSEMFGLTHIEGQNEFTPIHPRSPYGVSKVAAYWSAVNYREAYNIHASNGLLFNHESPYRGLDFVTRKVTDGVARIIAGKAHDLKLGNMDAFRDWGFAGDFVEAMWLMLQQDEPDEYVIATGETHTVREMVDYVFDLVNLNADDYVRSNPADYRPTDIPFLCGDPSKAKERLGWKAETGFKEMMRDMLFVDLHRHGIHSPVLKEDKDAT